MIDPHSKAMTITEFWQGKSVPLLFGSYSDGVEVRWWVFVAAEIDDDPSDIPQKRDRYRRVDERQERLDNAQRNTVIPTLRTIPNNVALMYR